MPFDENNGVWYDDPPSNDGGGWFDQQPPPQAPPPTGGGLQPPTPSGQTLPLGTVPGQFGNYTYYNALQAGTPAGDPQYNQRQAEFEGQTNWGQIENQLRQEAAERGIAYDPSDLEGIRRNAGYDASHQGAGGGYASAIDRSYANALQNYGQRQSNAPGPTSGGGGGSIRSLGTGSGVGGGSGYGGGSGAPDIPAPWTGRWQAPDPNAMNENPGFRFRLNEGLKALQRSAASRGTLLTGGTLKALEGFGQDMASQEYGNIYDRAYNDYQTGRTDFMTNEANRYNAQRNNRLDNLSVDTGYWNIDRGNRMDDYTIYTGLDDRAYSRLRDIANYAPPQQPNAPIYPY